MSRRLKWNGPGDGRSGCPDGIQQPVINLFRIIRQRLLSENRHERVIQAGSFSKYIMENFHGDDQFRKTGKPNGVKTVLNLAIAM